MTSQRTHILSLVGTLLLFIFSVGAQAEKAQTKVLIKTNHGNIEVVLFDDKAPESVKNFLQYVNSGFYNNTIFHRVIANFMIQGGGFTGDMVQKATQPPVRNEAGNGIHNNRGTLAMARTNDPNSATSQFFINVVDNFYLDRNERSLGYAVFGKVTEGMDVVDKISTVETTFSGGMRDVPAEPVVMESVTVVMP